MSSSGPRHSASYVITTVHGRHDHLRRLREGLGLSTVPPADHIVVAMDDDAVENVAASQPVPLSVVSIGRSNGALPLSAARNLGAAQTGGHPEDLLIFLDVDCIPTPRMIEAYEDAAERRPQDLLCGPVSYLPDVEIGPMTTGYAERLARLSEPHPARPTPAAGEILTGGEHDLFWSLSFAIRREVWDRIKGFDERYTGYGGEDTDFARRARQVGVELSWIGGAQAFHQYHPVSSPPVEHLDDILTNGRLFAQQWGQWPMQGWLDTFEDRGLIRREDSGYQPVQISVASVPESHVYVRHLAPIGGGTPSVVRLADPPPTRSDAPLGAPWWPPAMLDPEWIRGCDADIFHIHFGFDAHSPAQLHAIVDALEERKIPLVYTVHDLQNPHHEDEALHASQLDVLIPRATEVITLSQRAAEEIRRWWNINAHVVPHPHVVELETIADLASPSRRHDGEFRLGIHLKSLRANMVGVPLLRAAAAAVAEVPGGVLQVNVHHDVFDEDGSRHDPELVQYLLTSDVELQVHDYFSDRQLFEYLASLHASLLPYRFGTHSGWMEACHDLGTQVIAPEVGCYRSQGADSSYSWTFDDGVLSPDVDSLQAAVLAAYNRSPQERVDERISRRRRQRNDIATAHTRIYRSALAKTRS
ncbi:hypothetical protein BLSMQ_0503 [Brevibacterium aurantiacum]|uniref:Uncharacterized protein n=2 Tax=Brevibacterium aurantiacum TaxID=273384 RepID=A0A1D7VZR0_BREAU|nr:hypothetical protein BLSMQ_0503 [Brevibacterium aurantiacum]